jgi:mannose-6-phosphate isomerase-like protein (cupin superfamily)
MKMADSNIPRDGGKNVSLALVTHTTPCVVAQYLPVAPRSCIDAALDELLVHLHAAGHAAMPRVQVATSPTSTFSGASSAAEHVDMPLVMFLEHFLRKGSAKDVLGDPSNYTQYYLSQCTIQSADPHFVDTTGLSAVFPTAILPDSQLQTSEAKFLFCSPISSTHLWMSPHATVSTAHFDAEDNLLVVIKGSKLVALAPPNVSELLSFPLSSTDSHHSTADLFRMHTDGTVAGTLSFDLQAGDALFIPEGWWHAVKSQEGTISVNHWFAASIHSDLVDLPAFPHTIRRYFQQRAHEALDARLDSLASARNVKTTEMHTTLQKFEQLLWQTDPIPFLQLLHAFLSKPGEEGQNVCELDVLFRNLSNMDECQAYLRRQWGHIEGDTIPTADGEISVAHLFARLWGAAIPISPLSLETAFETLLQQALQTVLHGVLH